MTTTHNIKQKIEEEKHQPRKLGSLSSDMKRGIASFLSVNELAKLQQVSKTTSVKWDNIVWKHLFQKHYPEDFSRLQRDGQLNIDYLSEYKICDEKEKNAQLSLAMNCTGNLNPSHNIVLLNLFKDGRLAEIKAQQPRVTLETVFQVCDRHGRLIVQWAGKNGHQEVLDHLFKEALAQYPDKAGVNEGAGLFNAPRIYWAACFNQGKELDRMLEAKEVNVNERTQHAETALHVAAFMGNTKIVSKLLAANAEVDAQEEGWRMFHDVAAQAGLD
jgi:hypothetical protein